jgi:putative addiction module CopG family antidote
MRSIINISLPHELKKEVDNAVKSGKYATKSEFFRALIRLWQEEKLLQELRESQKEIAQGKGKVLKSFKDLRRQT